MSILEKSKEELQNPEEKRGMKLSPLKEFGFEPLLALTKIVESESSYDFHGAAEMLKRILGEGIDKFYTPWKRNDKRVVVSPDASLKKIQKGLLSEFYDFFEGEIVDISGFGAPPVEAVAEHRNSQFQFSIDLASAYDQVCLKRVRKIVEPFAEAKRIKKHMYRNENEAITVLIANLLTVSKKNAGSRYFSQNQILYSFLSEPEVLFGRVLPQGAPTSPFLFELACRDLDQELKRLAETLGCKVTRYADDIQLSSAHPLTGIQQTEVINRVQEYFKVNPLKTRYIEKTRTTPFRMLGLTVLPEKDETLFKGGRIRIPRNKSDWYQAVLHQICDNLKQGVEFSKIEKQLGQANGIVGHITGLKQVEGFELRTRLQKRLQEFKKLRKKL